MNDDSDILRAAARYLGLKRPSLSISSPILDFSSPPNQSKPIRSPLDGFLPPITSSIPAARSALNDILGLPLIPPKPKGIPIRIAPPPPKDKTELSSKINKDTKSLLTMNIQLIQAQKIPAPQEIATNEAKVITTSVLHVDMRKSSQLLETFDPITALRIYKIFHAALVATARLQNGRVRTFAGDRIGVVFDLLEKRQRSVAVETALLMEEMINDVVNPILSANINHEIEYGIGIDYGKMFVGKIGQSGTDNNDLAWVGKAMSTASKLADITKPGIYITNAIFTGMSDDLKDNTMIWNPINHPEHGLIHQWLLKV